jgi:nucleoside-triphosphatase THEP1
VIYILTGPVHSGKTTLLKKTIPVLRENDLVIDGYLSEAIWESREFIGYDLIDLKDHLRHPFIRKKGQKDWQRIGPFYFIPGTLDLAKKIIQRSEDSDLCVVDEVGPLELQAKGVWPALKAVLKIPEQNLLFVVRETMLEEFMEKIRKDIVTVYNMRQTQKPIDMLEALMKGLKKTKKMGAP